MMDLMKTAAEVQLVEDTKAVKKANTLALPCPARMRWQ